MTDPIADMLTRIRNALLVRKTEVLIPYSKIKHSLANLLLDNQLVAQVSKQSAVSSYLKEKPKKISVEKKQIKIIPKYDQYKRPLIKALERISKPGRRVYSDKKYYLRQHKENSFFVISTSQGLMTDREARRKNIGGEVICKITPIFIRP